VEIFPPEYGEPAPLHLICAHRAQLTPVVNALHAFLRERCAALAARYPSGGPRVA
jgi:hypothetical protein